MDDAQLLPLRPPLIALEPQPGTPIGRSLRMLESRGQRAVFFGPTPIHLYDADDQAAEAAAFGCHRNTVGRLAQRLAAGGMAAVAPAKRGPKGPHKVTPAVA